MQPVLPYKAPAPVGTPFRRGRAKRTEDTVQHHRLINTRKRRMFYYRGIPGGLGFAHGKGSVKRSLRRLKIDGVYLYRGMPAACITKRGSIDVFHKGAEEAFAGIVSHGFPVCTSHGSYIPYRTEAPGGVMLDYIDIPLIYEGPVVSIVTFGVYGERGAPVFIDLQTGLFCCRPIGHRHGYMQVVGGSFGDPFECEDSVKRGNLAQVVHLEHGSTVRRVQND